MELIPLPVHHADDAKEKNVVLHHHESREPLLRQLLTLRVQSRPRACRPLLLGVEKAPLDGAGAPASPAALRRAKRVAKEGVYDVRPALPTRKLPRRGSDSESLGSCSGGASSLQRIVAALRRFDPRAIRSSHTLTSVVATLATARI